MNFLYDYAMDERQNGGVAKMTALCTISCKFDGE